MPDQTSSKTVRELFSRLGKGDEEALDLIYRRYYLRLKNYGLQLVGPGWEEEVHGVVQEIFMWLAENYYKAEKIKKPEAYLFRSVRRNLILLQNHSRNKEEVRERFLQRSTFVKEKAAASPEESFIRKEIETAHQSLLHSELHQLPPYLWETLYLRYYEGLSYKEIGALLSISDQVARNYAHRAIKKLKEQLQHIDHLILSVLVLRFLLECYG